MTRTLGRVSATVLLLASALSVGGCAPRTVRASAVPTPILAATPRGPLSAALPAPAVRLSALPTATAISAGMSGDFREAILEGATHLRIGTAITGKRVAAG